MKIKIGDYIIENDRNFSFMLSQKVKTISNNNLGIKGKNDFKIIRLGYFANLEQVFNKILNNELLESDVKNIEELNAKLDEIKNEFAEMKKYTIQSIST